MNVNLDENFSIKIEIDNQFEPIGGICDSKLNINHNFIRNNEITQNIFQKIHKTKISYFSLTISGIYTKTIAEDKVRYLAITGEVAKYQLSFEKEDNIVLNLLITNYERISNIDREERYNISFESSGEIQYQK